VSSWTNSPASGRRGSCRNLLKRLEGFEGSLLLANRRSGEIVAVTLWESEEAMRATEGASYWLRAFSAEAAGGEVTGLERYEVVSSEAWRAQP
jgi:heme-degrading monooxygenase HmoA